MKMKNFLALIMVGVIIFQSNNLMICQDERESDGNKIGRWNIEIIEDIVERK